MLGIIKPSIKMLGSIRQFVYFRCRSVLAHGATFEFRQSGMKFLTQNHVKAAILYFRKSQEFSG